MIADINNSSVIIIVLMMILHPVLVSVTSIWLFEKHFSKLSFVKKVLIVMLSIALSYLLASLKFWVTGRGLLE